jgi:uncharacterized protein (DUF1015 family)
MVDVRPFAGIRYNPARVGNDLTAVVCPPYDVISPTERQALVSAHQHNFVRLELPQSPVADPDPLARYRRAAEEFLSWQASGVLVTEARPALYPYLQRFAVDGVQHERRGFVAALRLEPWQSRAVRPHEKTLSGPKQDRLRLIQATRANFSPIWVLYRDPNGHTERLWEQVRQEPAQLTARDRDGTEHAVWVLHDASVIAPLLSALNEDATYIADGHHRYETALHYETERAREEPAPSQNAGAHFALTYFVEMGDPGLMIHGTHRLLNPAQSVTREGVTAVLQTSFDFVPAGDSANEVLAALERAPARPAFGIWAPGLNLSGVAVLREEAVSEAKARGRSLAWRRLDLAALHTLAIDVMFSEGTAALNDAGELWYTRLLHEVDDAIGSGTAKLAFLVRKTPAEQVIAVADAGDLMPEKSTYFYPKPLSGMVISSLEAEIPPRAEIHE